MPQVAVFDTAFHQTMPRARLHLRDRRRPGATSTGSGATASTAPRYAFVSRGAAELLGRPAEDTNLVVLHLGNGASASAVRGGRSVDTSMGLTPLEGLVMGTRSGDLDPAILVHLHRELGWSLDEIDRTLNRESGLRGLSGDNDFREVMRRRAAGDEAATLAFDVYAYRVRKYVGAYYAALGERARRRLHRRRRPAQRRAAGGRARGPGPARHRARRVPQRGTAGRTPRSSPPTASDVAVLVIPTDEEWEIARQALALVRVALGGSSLAPGTSKVDVSALRRTMTSGQR